VPLRHAHRAPAVARLGADAAPELLRDAGDPTPPGFSPIHDERLSVERARCARGAPAARAAPRRETETPTALVYGGRAPWAALERGPVSASRGCFPVPGGASTVPARRPGTIGRGRGY